MEALKAGFYDRATNQERVLHTAAPHVDVLAVPNAKKAASHYTPVMLDNSKGVLDVTGYVPHEVILDMGATKIMLSKKFSKAVGIRLTTLTPGPEFITARGSAETTMGHTPEKLKLILSRGTNYEL